MAFSYPALVGSRGIRLLKFTGLGHDGAMLTFSLQSTSYQIPETIFIDNRPVLQRTADYDKKPIYHALSYVWGGTTNKETIVCNGTPVEVTKNLHEALGQLCPQFPDRVLWVDSLCINQYDSTEKAGQVAMMGEVFAAACNVICWLGPADTFHRGWGKELAGSAAADGSLVRDEFQRLLDKFQKCDRGLLDYRRGCSSYRHCTTATERLAFHEMIDLMRRSSWFSRVWTFQELIRSATAAVHMGPYFLSWNDFASANAKLELDRLDPLRKILMLDRFMAEFLMGHSSFAQCLTAMRDRESSIYHDKVFGIMGLLGNVSTLGVDYSLSVGELNAAVTRFLILEDQGPGLLGNGRYGTNLTPYMTNRVDRPLRGGCMPSWSVDICADDLNNKEAYINQGQLPELSSSGGNTLSLHGLVVGHTFNLQNRHSRALMQWRHPRHKPLSSIFKGLPCCMLSDSSPRNRRAASTGGSWAGKQSILRRLSFDYGLRPGHSVSARLRTIDDLTKVSEDPSYLYRGLKAHRLQMCGCPEEEESGPEEGDERVRWVCLLANPKGQVSPSLFVVEQSPDAGFAFRGRVELTIRWERTEPDVSESEGLRDVVQESGLPAILTPMALRG